MRCLCKNINNKLLFSNTVEELNTVVIETQQCKGSLKHSATVEWETVVLTV